MDYLIRRVDQSLDAAETEPSDFATAVHKAASSPAGRIAGFVVRKAVVATATIGKEAIGAAIPVARKVTVEGLKMVSQAIEEGGKRKAEKGRAPEEE